MKVSCLQENLAKGLSIVTRAVSPRSPLPVLNNVLLSTDNGRLRLSATNLEIGINCWIGAKVVQEGATTVPSRLLADFVNSLPPERIDLELEVRTQTLNARCARFEANIKGIDAHEFPPIPTAEIGEEQVSIPANHMRAMIEQVVFAAAADESRPILTGVLAQFNGDRLTLAAADGFRLSVRSAQLERVLDQPISVIIPARALSDLARILGDREEPVMVIITPARNQVLMHLSDVDLVSQLIEGRFPDYEQIIPKSTATRVTLDTQALLKGARVSHLFARDAANIVHLNITPGDELTPGRLVMEATSPELGNNVTEIDASVEGEGIEIAFNAKYMIDVLSVIETAQVALELTTPSSPGLIRPVGDEGFLHVVMPMHISR